MKRNAVDKYFQVVKRRAKGQGQETIMSTTMEASNSAVLERLEGWGGEGGKGRAEGRD